MPRRTPPFLTKDLSQASGTSILVPRGSNISHVLTFWRPYAETRSILAQRRQQYDRWSVDFDHTGMDFIRLSSYNRHHDLSAHWLASDTGCRLVNLPSFSRNMIIRDSRVSNCRHRRVILPSRWRRHCTGPLECLNDWLPHSLALSQLASTFFSGHWLMWLSWELILFQLSFSSSTVRLVHCR